MGGKLTLINSVLDGIPTYTMSLFRMPASIEKKLDSIRKQFLWDGNSDKKKIHLVKWQVVIEDKKKGGLGVRNLKLHNRSFLFKWLWRYTSGSEEIWQKIIDAIYGDKMGWNKILHS